MKYSRLTTNEELIESLEKINKNTKIEKSGIPFTYDEDNLYIESSEINNLVIGTTGSGKTQSTVLPLIKLAAQANENIVINDENGELYNVTSELLKDNGYKILVVNTLNNEESSNFNPFTLPYELLKNNNGDLALDIINNIASCIYQSNNYEDPFWNNSSKQLFIGIAYYIMTELDKVPTFTEIYNISNNLSNIKYNEETKYYQLIEPIVKAPSEIKGGILSVAKQKLGLMIYKDGLNKILSTSDENILDLVNEKYAIYFIGETNTLNKVLFSIILDEVYESTSIIKLNRRTNIIIDNYDKRDITERDRTYITNGRSKNLRYTCLVNSLKELDNKNPDLFLNFGNIIYLLSNDLYTLETLEKLCGKKDEKDPLISVAELQRLKMFESIIIRYRMFPIKTKLIPDYEIKWK